MFEISVEETFAAGHALRGYHGKCEKVHGHNYKVRVSVEGESLDAAGLLIDFAELRRVVGEVIERLDHQFLNDLAPFDTVNPTAENLARYFYEEISIRVPAGVRLAAVRMWETDTSAVTYRP